MPPLFKAEMKEAAQTPARTHTKLVDHLQIAATVLKGLRKPTYTMCDCPF